MKLDGRRGPATGKGIGRPIGRAIRARLPFDCLVDNAGITHLASALDTTEATMNEVEGVNMLAAQRGAPGAIVNTPSVAAAIGFADHVASRASKGAPDALTRVLALEWGPRGTRVDTVNPTVTLGPAGARVWSDPGESAPMPARIPLGRFVEPDEVARTIAFLLSDDASLVDGVSLDVGGGLRAS